MTRIGCLGKHAYNNALLVVLAYGAWKSPSDPWMAGYPWYPSLLAFGVLFRILFRDPSPFWSLFWFWVPIGTGIAMVLPGAGMSVGGAVLLFAVAATLVWTKIGRPTVTPRFDLARGFLVAVALAIAWKMAIIALYGLPHGPNDIGTSTLLAARRVLHGRNPYTFPEAQPGLIHQQNFMYPPLGMAAYLPLAGFGHGTARFASVFVTNLGLDLAASYAVWRVTCLVHGKGPLSRAIVLVYLLNPILNGQLYANGANDAMPALASLIGLDLALRSRHRWAVVLLSLGAAAKWFPGILLAGELKVALRERNWRAVAWNVVMPIVIFGGALVPFLLEDWREVRHDLTWESVRPLDDWEGATSAYVLAGGSYTFAIHLAAMAALWALWKTTTRGELLRGWLVATMGFVVLSRSIHLNYLMWFHAPFMLGVVSRSSEVPLEAPEPEPSSPGS